MAVGRIVLLPKHDNGLMSKIDIRPLVCLRFQRGCASYFSLSKSSAGVRISRARVPDAVPVR